MKKDKVSNDHKELECQESSGDRGIYIILVVSAMLMIGIIISAYMRHQ